MPLELPRPAALPAAGPLDDRFWTAVENRFRRMVERHPIYATFLGIHDGDGMLDDASRDATAVVARDLGIKTIIHPMNRGYGGNQKTCYAEALSRGADIVVMVHPDYQYSPRLMPAMASMVSSGHYDIVLGSRILGGATLRGGMPRYKYVFNRLLTALQNLVVGTKLSEFHTGYRAFARKVIETLPLAANSQDFVFDNQMLIQAHAFGLRIGEISCPTRYFEEASQISFRRSVMYGFGVLWTSLQYRLWRWGWIRPRIFSSEPELKLGPSTDARPAAT